MIFTALAISIFVQQMPMPDHLELGRGDHTTRLFYHYPPDPVNIRTLNFYYPVDQLSLPCFMPIEIKAAYNSYSGSSSMFGEKWTFNHNLRVKAARTHFEVLEGDGFVNIYTREKNLEEAKLALVEQLLVAKKKADALAGGLKAQSVYDDFKKQAMNNEEFRDEQANKLLTAVKPLGPGKYFSFSRGPSTLEMKADGSFIRTFQNASSEVFNKEGRITRSNDRNGNHIDYAYVGENLSRINDMCGRYVNFTYQTDPALKGLVATISDTLNREIKYTFFAGRRLKSITDVNKRTTEYTYDKVGNMLSINSSNPKESLSFEYNSKYEVIKQKGPGSSETRYERTFVANNVNHSITKLTKLNNGKVEGQEVQEFKSKEFESVTKLDAGGKELKREIRKLSPETGYPVSILDSRGNGDLFEYDGQSGNLLRRQAVPSGEVLEFRYDPRCNQVTKMVLSKNKKTEAETTFVFDDRCNLKEAVELHGAEKVVWITLKYTSQGKIAFMTDEVEKKTIAFTYWQYGKPESITLKDSGTLLVKYNPTGEIADQGVTTFAHGKGVERFKGKDKTEAQSLILTEVRSSLDRMLNYLRPAGLNIGL